MKVLFAISNEEISESIVKRYQAEYKQIISSKNVYYFNAILKEIQKDKSYDRIVISEDLEAFTHSQYDQIDKFIFDRLDSISDEAANGKGSDIPIILICTDRRTKSEEILVKLFGIGIYNALIGTDRSVEEVCKLLNRPRTKKEAKDYYKIDSEEVNYMPESEDDVSEIEIQNILAHYKRLGKNEAQYVESFDNIAAQYNDKQLRVISKVLPLNVKAVLEEKSDKYRRVMTFNSGGVSSDLRVKGKEDGPTSKLLQSKIKKTVMSKPVVIPSSVDMNNVRKLGGNRKYTQQNQAKPVVPQPAQNGNTQTIISHPVQNNNVQTAIPQPSQNNNTQTTISHPVQNDRVQTVIPNKVEPKREVQPVIPNKAEQEREVQPVNPIQQERSKQETEVSSILPGFESEPTVIAQPEQPVIKQENSTILPGIENQSTPQENIASEPPVEEKNKKRRGRPRKNPIQEEQKGPKRRRGRPRKNPIQEEEATIAEPVIPQPIMNTQPEVVQQPENQQVPQQQEIQPIQSQPIQSQPIQKEPELNQEPVTLPGIENEPKKVPERPQPVNDPFADVQPLSAQIAQQQASQQQASQQQVSQQQAPQQQVSQQSVSQPQNIQQQTPIQSAKPNFGNTQQTESLLGQTALYNDPFADIQPLNIQNTEIDTPVNTQVPETTSQDDGTGILPGFEDEPQLENDPFDMQMQNSYDTIQPEVEKISYEEPQPNVEKATYEAPQPNIEKATYEVLQPNVEKVPYEMPNEKPQEKSYEPPSYEPSDYKPAELNKFGSTQDDMYNGLSNLGLNNNSNRNEYESTIDLARLLTPDKKLVTCLGTSKNGTSFIVNNLAELTSSMGIKTAILDTTTNRNSYYIYTKNEENLREIALNSFDSLINKQPEGIQVNKNLTVFTSLPDDENKVEMVDEILETLINNYSLILIDADFNTPIGYFKQTQELYLVQSLDILTIQPLTAFLRKLKSKNALEENKIRIVLNKAVKVRGIQEKTIIGGMAYYTDPAMSYMTELFDRNTVKYITIPFEDETYIRYLENIINCEITLKGYSKAFMQSLKELANMVYPLTGNGQPVYRPPQMGSNNMNSTLDQMRRNY